MDNTLPKICTAPFSSVLIDINKNIKPCNQYAEGPIRNEKKEFIRDEIVPGNLKQSTLRDVLNNDRYTELKKNMHEGVVPKGCEWCLQREKETGFSQRQAFMPPGAETYSDNKNTSYNGRLYYEDWHKGITVLEIDTSNICNLTCAGCDSFFSSMWKTIEDNIEPEDNNRFYMKEKPYRHVPYEFRIGNKIIHQLAGVNLSHLKRVIYKGGEPFLNKDMIVSLRYFDRIGVLPNLTIGITTNGTIVNPLITKLLDRAKRVEIVLSVDGPDEVNRYIRHSPTNLSSTENLVNFCNQFHTNRVVISMMPTIMVYNIFSLDKLLDWWLFEMKPRYDNAGIKTMSSVFYSSHFLRNKAWLTLRTLQPHTIKQLIKHYEEKSKDPKYKDINKDSFIKSDQNPFENLIHVLKNTTYGGEMLHDQMVKYTRDMDAIKGQNVLDAVPELKQEMVYLTLKHPRSYNEIKLQELQHTWLEIFYNKIKQKFADNNTYVTDLGGIRDPK